MLVDRYKYLLAAIVIAVAISGIYFLSQRGPATVESEVETGAVFFSAPRPIHSKGLFASPALVDIKIDSYGEIQSVAPEVPIRITPLATPMLDLRDVVLDSVDMANPLDYELRASDGALVMNLHRSPLQEGPICAIRLQANSKIQCANCQGRKAAPEIAALLTRLTPKRGSSTTPITLRVLPSGGRVRLVLRPAASHPSESVHEETMVRLNDGTSVSFMRDSESALRNGILQVPHKQRLDIQGGDSLELVKIENGVIDRIAFDSSQSLLSIRVTARARQTLYGHGGDRPKNINPRRLPLQLSTSVSLSAIFGALATLWKLASRARKSWSRNAFPKESKWPVHKSAE
ncbi:MAG TPA: hypothetical protein VHU83_16895 [Bryobacteraceae bacterium]|jgi:hypothetical protein|nr:hypothetical protein [Bryobacteraceae bacterium]